MSLDKNQMEKLEGFLGYGNLKAPIWFLGMEEGIGGNQPTERLAENIDVRVNSFSEIMDLAEAHDRNHLKWEYWDINQRARFPSVWRYMARISLLLGQSGMSDYRAYVRDKLGRVGGETFLTEMLPLPKFSAGDWPENYKTLYKTREEYEVDVLPRRKAKLRQLIQDNKPRFLFGYGRKNFLHFKELANIPLDNWKRLDTKAEVEVAKVDHTQIVITPFWGNGAIGYKDMEIIINYLKSQN